MQRTFAGPAGQLAYTSYGGPAGRPVVLLPGLTCHAGYWDAVATELAEDFPVYALDWRGHGGSDHATSYGFADYVADLDAFLAHEGLADPALVGHSLGGYVALLRATRPGIGAVAALDVKTSSTPEELKGARKAAAKPQPRLGSPAELAARLKPALGATPDELVATLAARGARENEDGSWSFRFDRAALAIEPVEPFAFAGRVQARTLVAHGAASALMDADQARALAAAVPGARCETVPDAGHHLMVERPGAVAALIKGFLVLAVAVLVGAQPAQARIGGTVAEAERLANRPDVHHVQLQLDHGVIVSEGWFCDIAEHEWSLRDAKVIQALIAGKRLPTREWRHGGGIDADLETAYADGSRGSIIFYGEGKPQSVGVISGSWSAAKVEGYETDSFEVVGGKVVRP